MNNNELDIKALLGTMRRQMRLIVSIIFIITSLAAAVSFSLTPKYRATSLLYVNTNNSSLLNEADSFSNAAADNTKVASEVEIAKSDGVVLDLIEKLNLVSNAELGVKVSPYNRILTAIGLTTAELPSGEAALASVIQNVKNSVQVRRQGLTYILSVSAISVSPEFSSELANGMANSYINAQLRSKVSNIEVSLNAVRRQLEETESIVATTQESLDNFIVDNLKEIAELNKNTNLAEMRDRLLNLTQQETVMDLRKQGVARGLGGGLWVSDVSSLKSDALRALESQRARITNQISRENLQSLAIEDLRTQLRTVETQIEDETNSILAGIDNSILSLQESISTVQTQLTDTLLSGDVEIPDNISTQLFRLSQQSRNTTSQYQTLLAKAQELEAEKFLQTADTRIISPAITPVNPISPNIKLILAAAIILGSGLAIAVAFIVENFVGGFTTTEQVEAISGVPVATSIIKVPQADDDAKYSSQLIVEEPLSIYSESLRKLKTSVQIALKNQLADGPQENTEVPRGKVIMISSAMPSEGKTNIAISLAQTLAISGAKTIVIDCDIRKPSVGERMGISTTKNLANVLNDKVSAKSIYSNLVLDNKTNLHALIGKRSDFNERQFTMGFQPLEEIIDILRSKYDYIVLDTSPIGPVADALTLSESSDVVVFVIKWAKTQQKIVLESLKLIESIAPETKVMTVLNQVNDKSRRNYAQYSGYYSDA